MIKTNVVVRNNDNNIKNLYPKKGSIDKNNTEYRTINPK